MEDDVTDPFMTLQRMLLDPVYLRYIRSAVSPLGMIPAPREPRPDTSSDDGNDTDISLEVWPCWWCWIREFFIMWCLSLRSHGHLHTGRCSMQLNAIVSLYSFSVLLYVRRVIGEKYRMIVLWCFAVFRDLQFVWVILLANEYNTLIDSCESLLEIPKYASTEFSSYSRSLMVLSSWATQT